jgi:hypothetical protein
METKHFKYRVGVTLIELMVTLLIAMLVLAGIGVAMVDSIRSFPKMYERTTGNYDGSGGAGIIPDSYVARAAFDSICRKASAKKVDIDPSGTYLCVYYYNSSTSSLPDRYAQFRRSGASLLVDHGNYDDATNNKTLVGTQTLATTVDPSNPPKFAVDGAGVIMILGLKKDNQTMTVTSTAFRHNL